MFLVCRKYWDASRQGSFSWWRELSLSEKSSCLLQLTALLSPAGEQPSWPAILSPAVPSFRSAAFPPLLSLFEQIKLHPKKIVLGPSVSDKGGYNGHCLSVLLL